MLVNNINFGKTMRVVGNNSAASAYRMADLINGHAPKTQHEAQVQNQLWEIFPDAAICYPAQALNLNNGKDVFVMVGNALSPDLADIYYLEERTPRSKASMTALV